MATIKDSKGKIYKIDSSKEINRGGEGMIVSLNNGKVVKLYFEASRGCPFKCIYCLSAAEHEVRFLDINRVKKDLLFLCNKKVKMIKFVDRTFNVKKDFANEIWNFLM